MKLVPETLQKCKHDWDLWLKSTTKPNPVMWKEIKAAAATCAIPTPEIFTIYLRLDQKHSHLRSRTQEKFTGTIKNDVFNAIWGCHLIRRSGQRFVTGFFLNAPQFLYMNKTLNFSTGFTSHLSASRRCFPTAQISVINAKLIKVHLFTCSGHVTVSRCSGREFILWFKRLLANSLHRLLHFIC